MINEYLYYIACNKHYSPNTIRRYSVVLHRFAGAMQGKKWSTVSKKDIEQYVAALGNASSSVANVVSVIRSFYSWMMRHYPLSNNPARYIVSPKMPYIVPHTVDMNTIGVAVRRCASTSIQVAIMLMARCGLRVSEVLSLTKEAINNGKALIVGKGRKERYIFIPDYILNRIARICGGGLIFKNWDDRGFRKAIWKAFANVGANVSPHQLRHSFATYCVNQGMPINQIAMLMGHDDIRTTQRYLQSGSEEIRKSYNNIF